MIRPQELIVRAARYYKGTDTFQASIHWRGRRIGTVHTPTDCTTLVYYWRQTAIGRRIALTPELDQHVTGSVRTSYFNRLARRARRGN